MKANVEVDIKTPRVPNFILHEGTGNPIPIADFTDDELRAIGAKWTNELVALAQKRRVK